MFQSYQLNKQLTLVPNPNWNPATDPNAKQLASKIVVNLNVNQADIDNRLIAGDLDVDVHGTGVAAAAQARILASPTLKANADNAFNGRRVVRLPEHQGGADEQPALPGGGGVRGEQDRPCRRRGAARSRAGRSRAP